MKPVARRLALLLLLCLSFVSEVAATTFVIERYEISIKGRTRETAIRRLIGNDEGRTFSSIEELEGAVERKRQALLDQRIFKSVTADVELGTSMDDTVPVTVKVSIDGAISFLVLPSIYYDSNYGVFYQLFIEDQNFFGTTGTTKFSFIVRENDNVHSLENSDIISYVSTELPLGKDWNFFFKTSLHHYALEHEKTRLKFDNVVDRNLFESGFVKNQFILSINPESDMRVGTDVITDMSETFSFAYDKYSTWEIAHLTSTEYEEGLSEATDTSVGGYLNLENIIDIKVTPFIKWHYYTQSGRPDSNAFEFGVNASDSLINWYVDLRRGYSYSLDASIRTDGIWQVTSDIRLYCMPFDWMQLSTRAIMRLSDFPNVELTEGFTQYMRGIPNDNALLKGREINSVGVLNLDTLIHLFSIPRFVRIYANPYVDLGLVFPDEFLASAGLELMAILDEWPGSPARVSYGRNLLNPEEYELAIDVFFFY